IFVRRLEQIPSEDRLLLQAAARIVLEDEKGTLAQQLERRNVLEPAVPALTSTRSAPADAPTPLPPRELIFPNGFGGFTKDGHEYVITLQAGQMAPAPGVKGLGNPYFGTVISERGVGFNLGEDCP